MQRRAPCLVALALVVTACSSNVASSGVEVVAEPDRGAAGAPGAVGEGAAASATTITPAAAPTRDIRTVAVIGDSLTASATEEIGAALQANGLEVLAIDGLSSRRMANGSRDLTPGTEAISNVRTFYSPDAWVIALGTNDIGAAVAPEEYAESVRAVVAALPAGAPVLWVDAYIEDRPDRVSIANAVLRDTLAGRADSVVLDWNAVAGDAGMVTGDGVHLTDAGKLAFARLIADGVRDAAD